VLYSKKYTPIDCFFWRFCPLGVIIIRSRYLGFAWCVASSLPVQS